MIEPFDDIDEAKLRRRQSAKWRNYPPDVLPAWVAEMDFPLAPPIREALAEAIALDDCGYAFPRGLPEAFSAWALARYGWTVEPRDVLVVADVVTGISDLLRVATAPGDRVVIDPPVYPPFASTIRHLGRVVVEAPLASPTSGDGASLDLDAIERAYVAGARAHVLCSPHNPAGIVHDRATLVRLAALADRYDVLVLSDEIHAPLTLPGASHVPFPTVSDAAAGRSLVLTSASKAFNLAGLKAALVVASSERGREVLRRLPPETPYHAGHLGVIAAQAAFTQGDAWLARALATIDRNRVLLADLLRTRVPNLRYHAPSAGYLAWLDFRALNLPRDPARIVLERGRLALSPGPTFGTGGDGFARLNIATSRGLLEEAVRRIALAVERERDG